MAIVHDYITQRGGAERVVLSMMSAFPQAELYTALYEPKTTFPEFRDLDVHTSPINNVRLFRKNHRLALPFLPIAFSQFKIDADVVWCSSSGWAHGAAVTGRKIVYCYTPARWLYQPSAYVGSHAASHMTRGLLTTLRPYLLRWDRQAAATADRYIAISTAIQARIRKAYGIQSEVIGAPITLGDDGTQSPISDIASGYFLCISRLLAYKNVPSIAEAFRDLPSERLIIVGTGPEEQRLRRMLPANVRLLQRLNDREMRWLYANCAAVVAAAYEDYGLTPLEGASFGRPCAVLRWGGFLDTVVEGRTGLYFDSPSPDAIRSAILALRSVDWDEQAIRAHAERFSEERFKERLRQVTDDELHATASPPPRRA